MMDAKTLEKKLKFIEEYRHASNAATGSQFDSNANVTQVNIATMQCELGKKDLIDINRALTEQYIEKLYGPGAVEDFRSDLKCHRIYSHDESSLEPYCCSVSLYPYLLDGLRPLGGSSGAPKHANGFIGGLINLIFLISSQFAGAVSVPETLTVLDWFLRKDYGQDYTEHLDEPVEALGSHKRTLRDKIQDLFQQFVYSINQPAGARNYQSPFVNIAYFDKYYFESIFKDFVYPDGDVPKWETTKELQKMFMKWFNKERTKEVLTFPVETANILVDADTHEYKDTEMADFFAEMWSEGHSFFMYQSDSVDALASCCFDGDEKVLFKTDPLGEASLCAIKDLPDNMLIYHKGEYVEASKVVTDYRPMFEVRTETGEVIHPTDNHINVTQRGEVATEDLTLEDSLALWDNNSHSVVYTKIKSIEPYNRSTDTAHAYCVVVKNGEHCFTLPNGIITHNCRLRNEVEDNVFSYTLGAGGIKTGSKKVITINLNRLVQDWHRCNCVGSKITGVPLSDFVAATVQRVHKYLNAWNAKLWDDFNDNILPVYSAGYIDLDKQFLTVGVNGFVEAAEFLAKMGFSIKVDPENEGYRWLAREILNTIKDINTADRDVHHRYNTEFVPKNLWAPSII